MRKGELVVKRLDVDMLTEQLVAPAVVSVAAAP